MAEKKTTTTKEPAEKKKYTPKPNDLVLPDGRILINGKLKKEERVPVRIPRIPGKGPHEQEDLPLTINGKTILVQRGKEVEIPKPYYELLVNSEKMQEEADEYAYEQSYKVE